MAEDAAIKLIEHTSPNVINEPLLPFVSDSFSREKIMYLVLAQGKVLYQGNLYTAVSETFIISILYRVFNTNCVLPKVNDK